ncbi:MAG: beta-lactamase family protein [Desulfovibrio sp.]|nr:beta-lactamase family protein [Desulfovibrio sp.]MCA1986637.1 beta-lactamase family protein [Desulfovibrio sp.]
MILPRRQFLSLLTGTAAWSLLPSPLHAASRDISAAGLLAEFPTVPGLGWSVFDTEESLRIETAGMTLALGPDGVEAGTRFQACSISKPLAAALTLLLWREGFVQLDQPVNEMLRRWTLPGGDAVTIRLLLSHGAGVNVAGFPGYAPGAPLPDLDAILDGRPPANTPPVQVESPPAGVWSYSGGGYQVIERLLGDVTGLDFPTLLADRLLGPLGMTDSGCFQPPSEALVQTPSALARGHDLHGVPLPGGWHVYPEHAAAGVWSSPRDLARFGRAILRGLGGKGLLRDVAEAMTTPVTESWALGLKHVADAGRNLCLHLGSNAGFRCLLLLDLSAGKGLAVMTNGDGGELLLDAAAHALSAREGWPLPEGFVPTDRGYGGP